MADDQFNNIDKALVEAPEEFQMAFDGIDIEPPPMDTEIMDVEIEIVPDESEGVEIFFGAEEVMLGEEPEDFFANLTESLSEDSKTGISMSVIGSVEDDRSTREDWEEAYIKGLKLLGMKYEERTEPFAGATGVVHPVLNEAVTQFQAAAYKEMLPSSGPVRAQVLGEPTKETERSAHRVQEYMNYILMHEMEEYEPEFDQMLYFLGLAGSAFKKVYFDDMLGRPVSKFIPSEDVIVNYSATDLKSADRVTHVISITENDLLKMQVNGVYSKMSESQGGQNDENLDIKEAYDDLEGRSGGYGDKDFTLYESHCYLDVDEYPDTDDDGEETGIKLPYVVTVCKETQEVLSIRRNYAPEDLKKSKIPHFVQYKFTPGLGFYGFGLIHLLGNLSRTATSNLRQLIDAGTLSNMPSGFKARGMRIADEDSPLNPGEFRDVDVPGGDLKGSIVPLPYKEPSSVLFQLMGFVVEAAQKFVGTTDLGMGNVGNVNGDMPVGTTVALLERGSRVVSAVHKRLHSSMKHELKMLSRLIAENPQPYPYKTGKAMQISSEDFSAAVDILPVSDPNIFSMSQRVMLAQEQLQLAQGQPRLHNMYEAYYRVYDALGVKNIDQILPPKDRGEPIDPITENFNASDATEHLIKLKAFEEQDHEAHIAVHMAYMKSPVVTMQPAVGLQLEKHIYDHLRLQAIKMAEQSVEQVQGEVPEAQFQAQVARIQSQLITAYQQQVQAAQSPQQEQDPLVALKEKELQLKEQDQQADQMLDQAKLQADQQKSTDQSAIARERIQSQEGIADQRAQISREAQQNRGAS